MNKNLILLAIITFTVLMTSCHSGQSMTKGDMIKEKAFAFMAKKSRWIDITKEPYNADKTGKTDISELFQKALDDARNKVRHYKRNHRLLDSSETKEQLSIIQTIYFPIGTYLMEKAVVVSPAIRQNGFIKLVGQSRSGSVIKLADNSPNFADSQKPLALISYCDVPGPANNCFFNSVENLTIDVGEGNPGAIALRFHNNNTGYVRDVTLKSGKNSGAIGLDMIRELGGITDLSNLEVDGFDIGVATGGVKISFTFENIVLRNQRKIGFRNYRKCVTIRKLDYAGKAPAIVNTNSAGLVIVLDSVLKGENGGTAIINEAGYVLLRNVTCSGWENALVDQNKPLKTAHIKEYVTDGGLSSWPNVDAATLNLPVKEVPELAIDDPSEWAIVDGTAQGDDSKAIQAAIDSGASTVFLPRDNYTISAPLFIRGAVKRIDFGYSRLLVSPYKQGGALINIVDDGPENRVLERLNMAFQYPSNRYYIQNDSQKTVLLKDIFLGTGIGAYRNSAHGDLFIQNVASGGAGTMISNPDFVFKDQKVWARHFNPEGSYPHVTNDGGDLWVFGFKCGEAFGPYFVTRNHGRTELLGGLFNALAGKLVEYDREHSCRPIAVVDNSECSISGTETNGSGNGVHAWFLQDIDDERERLVARGELPKRFPEDPSRTTTLCHLFRAGKTKKISNHVELMVIDCPRQVLEGEEIRIRVKRNDDSSSAAPIYRALAWDNTVPSEDLVNFSEKTSLPAGKDEVDLIFKVKNNQTATGPRLLHFTLSGGGAGKIIGDNDLKIIIQDDDVDLKNDLQASYRFKNGVADDVSGNGHSGVLKKARVVQNNAGSAVLFKGKKKQGGLLNSDPKSMFLRSRVYRQAVSLWFKPKSAKGRQVIWQEGGAHTFLLLQLNQGEFELVTKQPRGRAFLEETLCTEKVKTQVPLNKWSHAVINIFRGRVELYLNGSKVCSVDIRHPQIFRPPYCPSPNSGFGNVHCKIWPLDRRQGVIKPGSLPFHGMIADVRVWKRALNEKEITKLASIVYEQPAAAFKTKF